MQKNSGTRRLRVFTKSSGNADRNPVLAMLPSGGSCPPPEPPAGRGAPKKRSIVSTPGSFRGGTPPEKRGPQGGGGKMNFSRKWSKRRSEGAVGTSGNGWFQRVPLSPELLPPRGTLGDPFFPGGVPPPEATRCGNDGITILLYFYRYQVWKRWNHDIVIFL